MAVRYVVEDNSWGGEVNVPRKEFGFNRLRYLWEHCPTGLLYFPNASQDDVNHDLARDIRLKVNALRFGYISIDLKDGGKAFFVFDRRIRRQDNIRLKDWLVALGAFDVYVSFQQYCLCAGWPGLSSRQFLVLFSFHAWGHGQKTLGFRSVSQYAYSRKRHS